MIQEILTKFQEALNHFLNEEGKGVQPGRQ
jgi:hypothetical protein